MSTTVEPAATAAAAAAPAANGTVTPNAPAAPKRTQGGSDNSSLGTFGVRMF